MRIASPRKCGTTAGNRPTSSFGRSNAFKVRIRDLPAHDRPEQGIFPIFTEGEENASRRFTWKDIAGKIRRRQEKQSWEFLFLGANQDAIATAAQMTIHAHNAATASNSAEAVRGRRTGVDFAALRLPASRVQPQGSGNAGVDVGGVYGGSE